MKDDKAKCYGLVNAIPELFQLKLLLMSAYKAVTVNSQVTLLQLKLLLMSKKL